MPFDILRLPRHRSSIELGVQDGFDGAVGFGADLDRPLGGGFDAASTVGTGQAHDTKAGPVALLRMGAAFKTSMPLTVTRASTSARAKR